MLVKKEKKKKEQVVEREKQHEYLIETSRKMSLGSRKEEIVSYKEVAQIHRKRKMKNKREGSPF